MKLTKGTNKYLFIICTFFKVICKETLFCLTRFINNPGVRPRCVPWEVHVPHRLHIWRRISQNVRRRSWQVLRRVEKEERWSLRLHCRKFAELWRPDHSTWRILKASVPVSNVLFYITLANGYQSDPMSPESVFLSLRLLNRNE